MAFIERCLSIVLATIICIVWCIVAIPVLFAGLFILLAMFVVTLLADALSQRGVK